MPTTTDFDQRPRRHPSGSARSDDVVRARHAQRPARDPRRLVAHGAVGRGDGDRRPQHRHLHAAGDGVAVRARMDEVDGGDPARRRRSSSAAASFRSSSAASTRSRRRSSPPWPRRTPGLSVLQIDAHADLRDSFMGTPHNHACAMRRVARARALHAGRHPQPVAGGGGGGAVAARRRSSTTTTCGDDPDWIDRVVDSLGDDVYITIDVRRLRSGDHAGDRHAGTGRAVVVRERWRCCGG